MSEENVETVRGIYREWERGNFRAGTDLFDHDTVLVLRTPLPEAGTYRGPEEIRGYMLSFLETWDDAAIEGESFQVWSFRGGRILRIESIRERDQALEAAGLRD